MPLASMHSSWHLIRDSTFFEWIIKEFSLESFLYALIIEMAFLTLNPFIVIIAP